MRIPTPTSATITVTSAAFAEGEQIPRQYTCKGVGTSPDLRWSGVPVGATSLALVVSDPDAPRGTFLHWLVHDIAQSESGVAAGAVPAGSQQAANSAGGVGWFPPCPPSGTHRYIFTLYALDGPVAAGTSQEILDAIARHAIASGSLTGLVSAP